MSQEQSKLYCKLFNSIDIINEDQINLIMESMDSDQAKFFLVEAIKYGFNRGLYTIGETEIISKAIRVISK